MQCELTADATSLSLPASRCNAPPAIIRITTRHDAMVLSSDSSQRRHGVKSKSQTESYDFPPDRCKVPTEEIMDAQNFQFSPKFSQMGNFSPKCTICEKNSHKR